MVARGPDLPIRALIVGLQDMESDGRLKLAVDSQDRAWLLQAIADADAALEAQESSAQAMGLAEFDSHVSRAGADPKVSFRREDCERIRAAIAQAGGPA